MPKRLWTWSGTLGTGRTGWDLMETGPDGTVRAVLWLPEGASGEVLDDVRRLAERTYEQGQEDRSAELPAWRAGGQQSPAEKAVDALLAIVYGRQDADVKRAALIAAMEQMLSLGGPPQPGQQIELHLGPQSMFIFGWSGRIFTAVVDSVRPAGEGEPTGEVVLCMHEITDEENEAMAAAHDKEQREATRMAGIEF
jgi:hypothetical protein